MLLDPAANITRCGRKHNWSPSSWQANNDYGTNASRRQICDNLCDYRCGLSPEALQQPCGFSPFPQRTLRPNSRHRGSSEPRPSFQDDKSIPDQNSIPDQKLDAAAAALEQVANVREDYQQRIEAAAPSDRQGIADEAKNALVKAITNHGLSVEEYTSILVVAQNDPVVREKIVQRIRSSPK